MLGAGSWSTWAMPPRSRAATRSALLALEISTRASSDSRAPGRCVEALEEAPRGQIRRALRERLSDRFDGVGELVRGHVDAARLALAVAHALVPQARPEALGQLADGGVAGQDELRAHLDHRAVVEPARPDPAADAVARLEHDDLRPSALQLVGGHQAGQARAHDGGFQDPLDPHTM